MKDRLLKGLAAALFALCGTLSFALDADLVSADITVLLRPDGKAAISHRLEWKASGGSMHGFYFQGEPFSPV